MEKEESIYKEIEKSEIESNSNRGIRERNDAGKMGTEPIGKLLASMAWPAILSMTIGALYNIVDSIFVARLSQDALTAVSFVMPMQMIMVSLTIGSGVGVNSLISRRLGEQNYEEANNAASISIRIGLFNYLIFLLLGIFATEPFIAHYAADSPTIYAYGCTYMRYVLMLAVFSAVEVILQRVMQATGNMKAPMICSLSGAITNIILDPILIFGLFGFPRLEVAGAAIATVIGQFIALLFAIFFLKRQNIVKIKLFGFKMNWRTVKDIYAVSIPSIVMQMIGSVMLIGYNTILREEYVAVAVLGIYQKLQSFIFMPIFGLNQGAMPIIGYNYGAKNKNRLMNTYKLGLTVAIIIMAIGFALFQFMPMSFLRLFNADERMIEIGVPALRRISLCFIPAAFGMLTSTLFQGTGHALYSLFSSLIRQLIGILPLAYILYQIGGVEASWFSFALAEILGCTYLVIMLIRLYNRKLKNL